MQTASLSPPLSSTPALRVGLVTDTSLNLLDDPQVWFAFSRPDASGPDCWESSVVFEGMHCTVCALTIEDALRQVPGVASVQVSAASHRGRVVWNSDAVRPSQWMAAAQQAGYRAVPASDAFANDLRKVEARLALWRWGVAGFCMMQVMMYAYPAYVAAPGDLSNEMAQLLRWASWVLSLPVLLFSCAPFWRSAWQDLLHRRVGMDLPVALGMAITFAVSTIATFEPYGVLGAEVYFDSFTMFVFFLLSGRWLELRLRDRTSGALEALMNQLPASVERLLSPLAWTDATALDAAGSGAFERVLAHRLVPGDVIRVRPGESFAADGVLLQGTTLVDEALLSGESRPLPRSVGMAVLAGSHNVSATVCVRVQSVGPHTRFAQIVALMDSAATSKPRMAQLVDRLARPFLLAVLLAAALACAYGWTQSPAHALMVAVAVLIVTCPCALSLATPTAMLAAAGSLARRGVLVRRLQALEALATVDTLVFDKTGTLTRDALVLGTIHTRAGQAPDQALAMAAALASHSLHPVSRALVAACHGALPWGVTGVMETVGAGLSGCLLEPAQAAGKAHAVRLGSARFCGLEEDTALAAGVHLADEVGWLATFEWQEDVRADARAAVDALRADGLAVHILSGDQQAAVARVAQQLGVAEARGGCTPADKLAALKAMQQAGHHVAMVGDGLNDGPVLAGAQVAIAFGQAVPLAQAQADIVVLGEQLMHVADTVRLARRTLRVVRQNLAWALAYNALCVPLAVLGYLPAWLAGLGMALSSLAVVGNALRLAAPGAAPVA